MVSHKFNLENFTIVKDDFVCFDVPVALQLDTLREDMFQAYLSSNDKILLDIGWYGETENPEGQFILFVIKNYNWEHPLVRISCTEMHTLKYYIQITLDYIQTNYS